MKRVLAVLIAAAVALPVPVAAQSNNDDFTPLNSRIKRNKQFPLEMPRYLDPAKMGQVTRDRSRAMLNQFSKCLYDRSNQQSLQLLDRTDIGFVDFQQIDMATDRAVRVYGFNDCLRRVSNAHSTGVQLRFSAGGLRQWLLQEAYLDRYPEGANWVKPGHVIADRAFPLSQNVASVRSIMDFADCVVVSDPFNADFYFRAEPGSPDEQAAIEALTPSLGPCLPQGAQVQLQPQALRVWLGEALWHAANHNAPAPAGEVQ